MDSNSHFSISFDQGTLVLTGGNFDRQEIKTVVQRSEWAWDPRSSVWRSEGYHYRDAITAIWNLGD